MSTTKLRPKAYTTRLRVERTASRKVPAPATFRPVLWNRLSSTSRINRMPPGKKAATTLDEANAPLPAFIARFAVAAENPQPAYRPLESVDLGHILCVKETRTLSNGYVFSLDGHLYQVLFHKNRPSPAPRARVTVCLHLDGSLSAGNNGNWYPMTEIPNPSGAVS